MCLEFEITRYVPNEQVEGPINTNILQSLSVSNLELDGPFISFVWSPNPHWGWGWAVASSLPAVLSGDRAFISIISLPEKNSDSPSETFLPELPHPGESPI